MTAPNRSTLWGRTLVEELVSGGLRAVCIAPGSRSTPLTVAFADHPDVRVFSHLDERSAAFFALGRARRTGEPTALVCTSGTAAANFHPAVIEADRARIPLLVLTADRPHELRDSGANQTIDQVALYGDAVRWYAELPDPEADERKVRSLRTTAARALQATTGVEAGPVHLNCPFRKPLEPTDAPGSVPDDFTETLAGRGRDGPFVETASGVRKLRDDQFGPLVRALCDADRPLIVAGPADPCSRVDPTHVVEVADRIGAPVLADPLSGVRFGSHLESDPEQPASVFGGYDTYIDRLPAPDVVVRFGASPTSKRLRHALRDAETRQFLLDPAGGWREATFTATDLLAADPGDIFETLSARLTEYDTSLEESWRLQFRQAENHHWEICTESRTVDYLETDPYEGAILASVVEHAPDPATLFISNSMPIRDADRFARPRAAELTMLANRGASGIDGITSTALGAGSATDQPLVLITGDLAFYHDSNGLAAIDRCGVDATIVLLDNDGGGIFHMLPIESFDPPFTEQFKTPHNLEFDALADCYGLEFELVSPVAFESAYRCSLDRSGTQVLAVEFDSERSHRRRADIADQIRDGLGPQHPPEPECVTERDPDEYECE